MYNRHWGSNLGGDLGGGQKERTVCGTTNSVLRLVVKVIKDKSRPGEADSGNHGT
jgi:hypothetical protein